MEEAHARMCSHKKKFSLTRSLSLSLTHARTHTVILSLQIREAAGAWADGVKGLVIAAKAVQGGGSSASGVSAASDATTQALTNLLELVAAGATAKHEIQAAARRLDSAVSSLRTTEFMVRALPGGRRGVGANAKRRSLMSGGREDG